MCFDYKIIPNLPSQIALELSHPMVCVNLEWELRYLQIFIPMPLLKFMKGSNDYWEMTNEFGWFYSQPTHYRMYRYQAMHFMKIQSNVLQ